MKQKSRIQTKKEQLQYKDETLSSFHWILLLCIIAFVTFVRIRLLSTPLERDEGEYAYMGQLLLQGVAPFQEAFNMKLPGTSMVYAFFLFLFGQTITAIHLGLLVVNVVSIVLLFLLTKNGSVQVQVFSHQLHLQCSPSAMFCSGSLPMQHILLSSSHSGDSSCLRMRLNRRIGRGLFSPASFWVAHF